MSHFERNIVRVIGKSKRLLPQFVLVLTGLMLIPAPCATAQGNLSQGHLSQGHSSQGHASRENSRQSDSWRRTANGWERTESWDYLTSMPVGKLRPLTVGTLVQRSWPASFAAVELSLVLLLMHFGSATESTRPEEMSASTEK